MDSCLDRCINEWIDALMDLWLGAKANEDVDAWFARCITGKEAKCITRKKESNKKCVFTQSCGSPRSVTFTVRL